MGSDGSETPKKKKRRKPHVSSERTEHMITREASADNGTGNRDASTKTS